MLPAAGSRPPNEGVLGSRGPRGTGGDEGTGDGDPGEGGLRDRTVSELRWFR